VRPPPGLEPRRFSDFEKELLERARTWIPSWGLADGERDFGRALLEVAARFSSEVAERLDQAGGKMARGFLDWLAVRGEAARPARMPVVFKLADTAREPVDAPHPIKMQVDAHGANVTFETETDVRLVPGRIELVVGVDPTADAFFLPPPGLSSLDPVEPLPTRWRLKSFAAPGSTVLQFDPGIGLQEGMLVEIEGDQYRISSPKDDLATIDRAVPAGDGFAINALVAKAEAFYPFERAHNQQDHALYLGHTDLLNIEAQATIDVVGAQGLESGVIWEYWGKAKDGSATGDDPRWRELKLGLQKPDALVLNKPSGAIEPRKVGTGESRWLRARKAHLDDAKPSLTADEITLRINAKPLNPPPVAVLDPAALPPIAAVVNTTPSPTNDFYPLGREPRMFDSLYLGCAEAFSKGGAAAVVQFDLAESSFIALAAINGGLAGSVLAGVDKAGALDLFSIGSSGALTRLAGREPLRPSATGTAAGSGAQGVRLSSSKFRPVMWTESNDLFVAVTAGNQVWAWKETRPVPSMSEWVSLGSLPPDSDPNAIIEGLVAIDAGFRTLVALRSGGLWMRGPGPNGTWAPLVVSLGATDSIESIAPVRSEAVANLSDRLLAIVNDGTAVRTLCGIDYTTGVINSLLVDVAKDVAPFGILRLNGDQEVIAAKEPMPRQLWASQNSSPQLTHTLESDLSIASTAIDGRIENGQLTGYCLALSTAGAPAILGWTPFEPQLKEIVFRTASDPSVGMPTCPLALYGTRAYLAGGNEGEILAALLGGSRARWLAPASAFKSALAIRHPAPALTQLDTVAVKTVMGRELATIEAIAAVDGRDGFLDYSFFWLDHWIERDTLSDDVLYFISSAPGSLGVVQLLPPAGTSVVQLVSVTGLIVGDFFVVDDGGGVFVLAEITALNGNDVTITPALSTSIGSVPYWLAHQKTGRVFAALDLGTTNNGWDSAVLSRGDIYFPELLPTRQHAIAINDLLSPPHPQRIALDTEWITSPVGLTSFPTEFVVDGMLFGWLLARGDKSTNPALSWEYWNGTGWWRLDIDVDQTKNLKNSGVVKFSVPADLKPVDWAGKTDCWIRARLFGGDYGVGTVVVKTVTTSSNTTEQTVERSNDGIQPPYALNVWVTYSIEQEVPPTFVLTQDSGTLRDQSDANRMPDAKIEIFTPLIYALRRLEAMAGAASKTAEACVPDCECASGTASTAPASNLTASTPAPTATVAGSRADRRALYLGFDSKLSGEPVNILLVVAAERAYDAAAPLNVDALVGDHFVPVVAQDNTRAIGETGLVSMSFSVEPISAELFGRTLSWLRLTPASAAIEWKPTLHGAYLNAVWAHAAETMTRELVGSSEGAPNLTLQLARPPLLKDSLELRVKEPLGTEERRDLLENDPTLVKSAVTDLPGDWVLWRQVADPMDHEASARVYSLDEDTGVVRFGDGLQGAIPPIGTNAIVAFKYERTEPATADGVAANFVGARAPLGLVTPVENVEAVIAADQAAGGVAPESGERVLHFGSAKLRHRGRAVTARDFEDLALERFADVVQAHCYIRGGSVRLVPVMRGADPSPSQAQRRELKRVLLAAAPAALAGGIRIESAMVRRFRIELTLRVATLDVAGELARHVKQTLQAYFDTDTGGNGRDGWALGASPSEDDIAEALLDEPYLESIVSVALSEIDAAGAGHPWPRTIKTTDLAMLANDGIRIAFEIAEAAA
jgi:hypothetical protein